MVEFIIARKSHKCAKAGPQREVNLFGSLNPNVDVDYFGPIRVQVILDSDPRALEKHSSNKQRNEHKVGQ